MKRFNILRSRRKQAGVVIAGVLLAGGVAFAFLQSQAQLTGNSISTASTGLAISDTDSNYGSADHGFAFGGIIPGVQASQTEHFLLKNTGSTPLALRLAAANPSANPSHIDLSKVQVVLTPYNLTTYMPGTPQTFSLQSLIDAGSSGAALTYPDKLAAGTKEEFNIQVSMDADAVSGSSAALSGIDLTFTGAATN